MPCTLAADMGVRGYASKFSTNPRIIINNPLMTIYKSSNHNQMERSIRWHLLPGGWPWTWEDVARHRAPLGPNPMESSDGELVHDQPMGDEAEDRREVHAVHQ